MNKNFTIILFFLLLPFLSIAEDKNEKISSTTSAADTISTAMMMVETAGMGKQMLQAIDEAKRQFSYSGKGVIITKTNSSNAFKYIAELENLLKIKGYDLLARGGVSMPMKGFKIVRHVNCVEIIIGSI